MKTETSEKVSIDFNTMLQKMKKLFEYYCQFGERLNTEIMGTHKFMKINKEAEVTDKLINKTRLEIIYKSENKNGRMNFQQFLNSLVKLAELKYQDNQEELTTKDKVIKLINEHYLPLSESIFKEDNNLDNDLNKSVYLNNNINLYLNNPLCQKIIIYVSQPFFEIYKAYFPHEISISEDLNFVKEQSLTQYFQFVKDFEIAPGLISKSLTYQIFQSEIIENDNQDELQNLYFKISEKINLEEIAKFDKNNNNLIGQYFNFLKFLRCIIKFSDATYNKVELNSISLPQKLVLFLQKIEGSNGFLTFELKTFKTHSKRNNRLINKDFLEQIKEELDDNNNNDINDNNYNNYDEQSKKIQNQDSIEDTKNEEHINTLNQSENEYKNNLLYSDIYNPEYSNYINETYGIELCRIFKGLCNFGDPFNYKSMKSKIWLKFLMEANLVKIPNKTHFGLKMNEIDTLFIKLYLFNKKLKDFKTQEKKNELYILQNKITIQDLPSSIKVSSGNKINNQPYIEFIVFLVGIEILAQILYPNKEVKEAIDTLINEKIFKYLKENYDNKIKIIEDKIEYLKELQNDEEYLKLLEILYKAVTPIFNFYTRDTNNLLNVQNFLLFAQQFEIFPTLVSKTKLNAFFGCIALYSCDNDIECEEDILIEQSLFVDIIALIANEIIYSEPQPTPFEKILILVEKMSQSEGPEKITKIKGSNRYIFLIII